MNRSWKSKLFPWAVLSIFVCTGWTDEPSAFPPCHTYKQLTQELRSLARQYKNMSLQSIAQSHHKRDVWLVEIGRDESKESSPRPALLIVGGVEGNRLVGTEVALAWIQHLCKQANQCETLQQLLQENTIYVIPRLNPDAAERYFDDLQYEQTTNGTPTDSDHDGFVDEDGFDDLNNDGKITWIRVEDVKGQYIQHPHESRIMVQADALKEEVGKWLYFQEGKDNDGDEQFNEDGLGGVHFNKNFPYQYPQFDAESGAYQLSEPETRALADFLIQHPNIGVVLAFTEEGNLLKTPESGDASAWRKPQTKLRKEDAKYLDYLGEQYREKAGISKALTSHSVPGSLADWVYFHRGRLALTTPVWNPEIAVSLPKEEEEKTEPETEKAESNDTEKSEESKKEEKDQDQEKETQKQDERGKIEREYLAWLQDNAPDYFMEWQGIEHPDYPGQKAEIGGFLPFAKTVPPKKVLSTLLEKHVCFMAWLAGKLPHIEIQDIEVTFQGSRIYDVLVKIRNRGYLPTVLTHGERTGEVFPTRVHIDLPPEQILAGQAITTIGPLEGGGGMTEIRYTLQAGNPRKVTVKVISALAGSDEQTFVLGNEGGQK